jgi:2-isopropylmalate synthase
MDNRVIIFDTTLRDGEQAPGFSMNIEEKLRMAHQLEALNVDILEAGFPIASEGDFQAVKRVSAEVRGPVIAGLARSMRKDIDRCAKALEGANKARIHVFLATSDIHLKYKFNKTREEALALMVDGVQYARTLCDNIEFSAEDAGRTDIDFLVQVMEAVIDAGATTVNLPDTVGYCLPEEYGYLIKTLRSRVRNVDKAIISTHCHNDLGLAVANSLAGIQNGIRQVECTINGIGERAGNAALEEIVMALEVRKHFFGVTTGINTQELYRSSQLLTEVTGMPVQANKSIVGDNAFAHEAGIHQDGYLKNKSTYEIMTPASVGVPEGKIVLGKHSGRHALVARCRAMGQPLSPDEIEHAYILLTTIADRKKKVDDSDLVEIIASARSKGTTTGASAGPA